MRELSVVGVRVELPSNQPIVLLREVEGDRYLPIWIGAVEATAIGNILIQARALGAVGSTLTEIRALIRATQQVRLFEPR